LIDESELPNLISAIENSALVLNPKDLRRLQNVG
jgi:hypothetical protein